MLEHWFNSCGYCTYWEDYRINVIMPLDVLYVCSKKRKAEILHT
jgi:hypothetical protein